jgi:lactoylglutathione lyase
MKRFHVHLNVEHIGKNVAFYTQLFGAEPKVVKPDYAKWMLDDPRVNFAISTVGHGKGVDHLGIQAEDEAELAELKTRGLAADRTLLDEGETVCCYARSEKHWVTDPQGIAWEHFQTLDNAVTVYGQQKPVAKPETACCGTGAIRGIPVNATGKATGACC